MKIFWLYFWLLLLLLLLSLYYYIKTVIDSLTYSFNIDNINLENLGLKDITSGKSFVKIKINFIFKFIGLFNISFSNLNIKAFYKNKPLVSSTNTIDNSKRITLIKNIDNNVSHWFDVQLNLNSLDLISKIKKNELYTIDYELSFKILGLTIKYKGKYENN